MPFMSITITRKKYLGIGLIILLGLAFILRAAYWFHLEHGYEMTRQQSNAQMKELLSFLSGSLSRYESIPQVLSTNPLLANALAQQDDPETITPLNLYLEEIQSITEALDIYLVNINGDAIAASNWQQSYSFIGKNFGFRPYFKDAMNGKMGRYFAVGTSSNKRGYYFSYPIYNQGYPIAPNQGDAKVVGAIVVKVDVTEIEQQSTGMARGSNYEFAISDPDNIIFLSSQPKWRLTSLVPVTRQLKQHITASRRYANRDINPLEIEPPFTASLAEDYQIYQIGGDKHGKEYMDNAAMMNDAGWRVHILSPMAPIYQSLPPLLLLYGALYLLCALALLFAIERRKNIRRMQQAHEQLEQRVKERTQALETSHQELKETQDELIQAAKLTVIGSLSASINHEINQPLAAIRSYAQNTQTLLSRAKWDDVSSNIMTIIELTDRLAAIVSQFKSFTRKSKGNDKAVSVAQCIKDALTIVQPEVDKQGINLVLRNTDCETLIWGDPIRLQQVLINLMSNAMVAMRASSPKQLIISVNLNDRVEITIEDTGTGIDESQMQKIFDPYYTSSRQGLGLGLSISRRIVEAMQGKISVANRAEGGAIFNITLPIHAAG
ncbi:sensor histidine kinase [Shewanella marisflavi]|uniref:C4-dicarboxylate transport sensor protein DctB n=1 Tax=Shewanella marisflavi TaxID=260364 RepID=A0AAC9XNS2_9GAMM|nr:ATP-binding protein [Shewanella marisflavi]ASJ97281.1 histidine kinase [Shewanella marisflavi]